MFWLYLPSCEQRYREHSQGTSRHRKQQGTEALGVDRSPRTCEPLPQASARHTIYCTPSMFSPHANLILPKGHRLCSACMAPTCLGTMWSEAMELYTCPSLLDGKFLTMSLSLTDRQTLETVLLDSRLLGHCSFLGLGQDMFRGLGGLGIGLHFGRDTWVVDTCCWRGMVAG